MTADMHESETYWVLDAETPLHVNQDDDAERRVQCSKLLHQCVSGLTDVERQFFGAFDCLARSCMNCILICFVFDFCALQYLS